MKRCGERGEEGWVGVRKGIWDSGRSP